MKELRSAVDAVLAEDPHMLPGPELASQLITLAYAMARLEAAHSAALAVLEARGAECS